MTKEKVGLLINFDDISGALDNMSAEQRIELYKKTELKEGRA